MQTIRIIIIDDQSLFNDGLNALLGTHHGIEIVGQVYDSRQAVALIEELKPALVVLDFNMPHINGLELAKTLKSKFSDLKILVLSMHEDNKQVMAFKKLKVGGYLNKSALIEEVAYSIKAIVLENKKIFPIEIKALAKVNSLKKATLSKRELEVLVLIKEGFKTKDIADKLFISFFTAETHRKNINFKLGVKSESELFKFIYDNDI
jgi:DNA-binding NarL/FixJ family response regulator